MVVTRIARAPSAYSSSMTWLVSALRDHHPHGDPARVAQRRHGRRLETRRDPHRGIHEVGGQVVVHQHVLVGDHDPLKPAAKRLDSGNRRGGRDQHGVRFEDDGAEDLQTLLAQRRSGLDDVGHGIRDAQPNRGLDRAVEPHDRGRDAFALEEVPDEGVVARRDAHTREVGQRREAPDRSREPEGRGAEVERVDLDRVRVRVEQQIASRDADVERAGAHIGGDVARAQVEELDVVAGVADRQLFGVATGGVPGLVEHLDGRLGERALVRDGDAQHSGFLSDETGSMLCIHRCR